MNGFARGALAALSLIAAVPGVADTLITMKVSNSGLPLMNRPATEGQNRIWLGEGLVRSDLQNATMILNVGKKKLYVINHGEKLYHVLDLPVDVSRMLPPDVARKMEAMKVTVDIEPTDERRSVGGYDARKYRLDGSTPAGMTLEVDLWIAPNPPFDVKLLKQLRIAVASMTPVGRDWMKTVNEIEGFALLTESSVSMLGKTVTNREEIISIEEKTPPEGTYTPPATYVETAFDPAGGWQ